MGRISTSQLARMRAQNSSTYDTTVIILAPSNTKDNAGGVTKGYAPVAGGTIQARVGSPPRLTNNDIVAAGGEALKIDYVVHFPVTAPIKADYRLVFGGYTYDILRLSQDQSINVGNMALVSRISNG